MAYRFDVIKIHNILLFLIHSLGGVTDVSRLFLLLYLSDLRHLARYGSLISGDRYVAMKYGPAPIHSLGMFREMEKQSAKEGPLPRNKYDMTIDDKKQVVASSVYKAQLLSKSEVECMFLTVHEYKSWSFEALSQLAKDKAWNGADINGEISIADMARVSGASAEMITYIEQSYKDETNSF